MNFAGDEVYSAKTHSFSAPKKLERDSFALDGQWDLTTQYVQPQSRASILLDYTASEVQMVLAGEGEVTVTRNGEKSTFQVKGTPQSYPLVSTDEVARGAVTVTFGSGVQAYSFTFG